MREQWRRSIALQWMGSLNHQWRSSIAICISNGGGGLHCNVSGRQHRNGVVNWDIRRQWRRTHCIATCPVYRPPKEAVYCTPMHGVDQLPMEEVYCNMYRQWRRWILSQWRQSIALQWVRSIAFQCMESIDRQRRRSIVISAGNRGGGLHSNGGRRLHSNA